ncbi:hypothetical protein FPV67DRAFT_1463116 [Lyophyllum atratum]|nr:hypothetical protein FPV67DRAFT_1463116 [Lyophyllum atratum]
MTKRTRTLGANAQDSGATCQDTYIWAYNSRGQSPCTVSAYLQDQCTSGVSHVPSLAPDHYYSGPNATQSENHCLCNSVVYSLLSACARLWSKWAINCKIVYINVLPISIPPETDIPKKQSDSFNVTAARTLPPANSDTTSSTNAALPIIGAACALVVCFSVGVIVFMLRRHRRRQRRHYSADAERPSYISFYKTKPVTTTSSYVGLRGVSVDEGHRNPSRAPPLTLRTEHSMDADRPAVRNDSLLSLPDNLYMPVQMETSPAAESSHMCTTPGGLTTESRALRSAGAREDAETREIELHSTNQRSNTL